ncbi:hypothetical protein LTR08_005857 [Meristemomyces frigidus]|nr:hypothetical protein LTR08_005857 [Meristemomyces frigidus]
MGLHHQSNHGRVFRGLDAKKHLEVEKRDSHGTKIKMNVPQHMKAAARPADPAQTNYSHTIKNAAAARPADPAQTNYSHPDKNAAASSTTASSFELVNKAQADVQTIESVVFVTASADFTGAVAGYTTLTDVTATPTDVAQSGAATSSAVNDAEASYLSAKAAASTRGGNTSSATITVSPTSSAVATASSSSLAEGHDNKSVFLNAPASAASTTVASTAAIVGAGVQSTVVVGSGVQATREAQISTTDNGMSGGAKAGLAIGILLAIALAGGLLFFCWRRRKNPASHEEILNEKRTSSIFGGKNVSEKRASNTSDKGAASVYSSHAASTAPRLSLRPVTQFLPAMANNRKSSGSVVDAMAEKPKSMWERRANPGENPFGDAAVSSEKEAQNPFDEPEGTESATSKSAQSGTASAVSVAPAASAKDVHRVQLDFKPSMEDELELKSGQLVRMLHEYDDGWALCIRMDRSQQGVAPRTCLSKLPVKPRPQSPTSSGSNARPMTPTGPLGMIPRPLTPTARDRADSNVGIERPSTPTGTVVPTRKPVPGQAI